MITEKGGKISLTLGGVSNVIVYMGGEIREKGGVSHGPLGGELSKNVGERKEEGGNVTYNHMPRSPVGEHKLYKEKT